MKIGIDARMLGPRQGGIGRYVEQLTCELAKICETENSGRDYVIFLRKDNWNLAPEAPHIKKVLADIPWYGWSEQICFPKIIMREKVDLMHFPHWNVPIFYNKKFIVTIHDLLLLHYPTRKASTLGPFFYFFKNLAYRAALNHAIQKSVHIISPSEFTKNDIVKTFDISPDKITAIPLAPATNNQPRDFNPNKYGITKPYILYVGVAYPHKNLDGLIDAWKIFCHTHGDKYALVLAGKKNRFYERLEQNINNGLRNSVVFAGYVPDDELASLYRGALLYIFPSFYEGFGLPPLEAMQYGVPVASSNAGSLPEVLKDAALYFDPKNKEEIASAIWRGISDENLRQNLRRIGAQLIHNYSWQRTTKATLELYGIML